MKYIVLHKRAWTILRPRASSLTKTFMLRETLIACLLAAAADAQAGSQASFEVASVKSLAPGSGLPIGLFTYPGGRIRATNCTLHVLIYYAYNLEMHQIVGGPSWADSDRFVIEAKPPETSPSSKWVPENFKTPPNPEMRLMLQGLLADRFQLVVHKESKEGSVFALSVAKGGPKLKPPADTTAQPFVNVGRTGPLTENARSLLLWGQNATMDQLALRLTQLLEMPVLNQTALDGHFDFKIEYGVTESQLDRAPALSTAIQDQIGLKMVRQRGPVETLVIDQARKPSDN